MMNAVRVVEVLALARAFVAAGWTKNCYAEDAAGQPQFVWADEACRFCAIGAVTRAVFELTDGSMKQIVRDRLYFEWAAKMVLIFVVAPGGTQQDVEEWQDRPERTKRAVLNLFDRAAAAVGKG
jgi:hypothetical protein